MTDLTYTTTIDMLPLLDGDQLDRLVELARGVGKVSVTLTIEAPTAREANELLREVNDELPSWSCPTFPQLDRGRRARKEASPSCR